MIEISEIFAQISNKICIVILNMIKMNIYLRHIQSLVTTMKTRIKKILKIKVLVLNFILKFNFIKFSFHI